MKIAIVNDVPMIAEALRRLIASTRSHDIAWVAQDGAQAVRLCETHRPDLVLMDLVMPVMDGVEATRQIMRSSPCAILVVTASPDENTNLVFRALGAGALDVVATPVMAGRFASDSALLAKIRTIEKLIRNDVSPHNPVGRVKGTTGSTGSGVGLDCLVAFGASTGGPAALAKIFSNWHPPTRCAAVVVQHIDLSFADSFAGWLSDQIQFPVDVIDEGLALRPGRVLLAKTNDHLMMNADHQLHYGVEPEAYPYRPSVDVFFRCVARHWKKKAIGVLLTGMGRDGGQGLLAMRESGQITISQDRASSAVYGMPRAAAELGAAEVISPLDSIAAVLGNRV